MTSTIRSRLGAWCWLMTCCLPLVATAGEPVRYSRSGEAETVFDAVGPAGFKLQGKTAALTVSQEGPLLRITVPLAGLETGISLRDRHLKEKYLEVARFPEAQLTVPLEKLKLPAAGASSSGEAEGTLSLHGVTRTVPFRYQLTLRGDTYEVVGTLPLNLTHFQIQKPSYLGVTVKPDLVVTSRFKLQRA